MESLKRGWGFFIQAWKMAFADKDLLKPTIYAMIAGFIVSLISIVPMVAIGFLADMTGTIGQFVFGAAGLVFVFVEYVIAYVFSGMTIYLIYGYLSEGDGRMDKAWAVVRRDFLDILMLAGASTLVKALENAIRGNSKGSGRRMAANFLNTIWTEATYLVLPAMIVEDLGLKDGLKRATEIAKGNLLLIGVSTVGVGLVTGVLGFILGGTGIALGLGIGFGLVTVTGGSVFGMISGIGVGGMVAAIFIILAVMVSKYTATAYHTCLYLWAMDVERAQESGLSTGDIKAPAPLASVL